MDDIKEKILEFSRSHPSGFTDHEFADTLPMIQWPAAYLALYELAFRDKKIFYDKITDTFIDRRRSRS